MERVAGGARAGGDTFASWETKPNTHQFTVRGALSLARRRDLLPAEDVVSNRDVPVASNGALPAPWEGANLPPGVYRWGLIGVTLLGAALRVAHIARPFNRWMAWNEGHYAMIALNFDRYGLWSQRNDMGVDHSFSPGVPWLIWGAFKVFGPTEWAARLPIVLSGIAVVVLIAALARRLLRSEQIALMSAGLAAVAPGMVYFSQNTQLDMPSIACSLAGAVMMLRYRDTRRWGEYAGAGLWLMIAIWFKFTAAFLYPAYLLLWWPARPARPAAAAATAAGFVVLTALPSALWVVSGWFSHQVNPEFYQRQWDLLGVGKALLEVPLEVEAHLFILTFVLLLVSIPALIRWRSRLRDIWVWCAPWIIQYFVAPWSSLANRYYDLPATSLLIVAAAAGLWTTQARRVRGVALTRAVFAIGGIIVAVTLAYDLWDPMTDRIALETAPHPPPVDPTPFYSAKVVGNLPPGRTVVHWPQTMFYAGGDPAWIFTNDGRWWIDRESLDYIVFNDYSQGLGEFYPIDAALRARLARHHYIQIAPLAWAHERTAVADLDGARPPGVPYWSPAPAWRLRGMAVWQ